MNLALLVAVLFLGGFVYNLLADDGDLANAAVTLLIAALLFTAQLFARRHDRASKRFLRWLQQHRAEILAGGAHHRQLLVTPETVLTRYHVALSCLIVSLKLPSRLYVVGRERTTGVAIASLLLSLLLGWWAIPWGPVYTLQALWQALRGGQRVLARELLAALPDTAAEADALATDPG